MCCWQTPSTTCDAATIARENLDARSGELVGDREPRQHELTVQLRAMDAVKSGASLEALTD